MLFRGLIDFPLKAEMNEKIDPACTKLCHTFSVIPIEFVLFHICCHTQRGQVV